MHDVHVALCQADICTHSQAQGRPSCQDKWLRLARPSADLALHLRQSFSAPSQVESWNETHDQFVADPSLQILPILHTKLTFYQLYREDAKCVDEIHEMNCAAKKILIQCRETFRDFKNGAPGKQKHICSSNKMHRLVHGGEQVTKFGNVENFLNLRRRIKAWERSACLAVWQ